MLGALPLLQMQPYVRDSYKDCQSTPQLRLPFKLTGSQLLTMTGPGESCWQMIGQVLSSSLHHAPINMSVNHCWTSKGEHTPGRDGDTVGIDHIVGRDNESAGKSQDGRSEGNHFRCLLER